MLAVDGIATEEDWRAKVPSLERLSRGPVVMIECFQSIPCDHCFYSCPQKAFIPFNDINEVPRVDVDKCNGCGVCLTNCPGLALFVVDYTYSPEKALVKIPYEFIPLPRESSQVAAFDRSGREVCKAEVVKVQAGGKKSKTSVLWLAVPREYAMEVRHARGNYKNG